MITVFTPVYNRKYIIGKLYESLLKQTSHDLEWLIIDDGSTDNLQELVEGWRLQAPFPIVYRYVKNGGKHRAINEGAKMAKGEVFFAVDSDDFLAEDAIEFIENEFCKIANDNSFAGIAGLMCSYTDARIIGGMPNFRDYVDATNLERAKYGLLGDKTSIYKTEIWKNHPLPEYEGENYLDLGIIHNEIASQGMKIRWYNKVLYYCEYIADGLTRNIFEKKRDNPIGWAASIISNIKYICHDEEAVFKERYLFYERMHQQYSKEKMCVMLEITETEYFELRKKWDYLKQYFSILLKAHQISSLAFYGMGMNAKRLLLYLNELGVSIRYGIDKNFEQIQFQPIYNLSMELPDVDSVCITIKGETSQLQEDIQRKLPNSYIWMLAEIDNIFT